MIDPYPLTIRRADGRLIVEEIGGDAWSRTIDLSGQFQAPLLSESVVGLLIAALLLVPVAFGSSRAESTRRTRRTLQKVIVRDLCLSCPSCPSSLVLVVDQRCDDVLFAARTNF